MFAVASLCMFIPNPSAGAVLAITVVMFGCAVVASFANSIALDKMSYFVAAALAIMIGLWMARGAFGAYGLTSCVMAAYCMVLLVYRGGADLVGWLGVADKWIVGARATWFAGAAGLALYALYAPAQGMAYQAAMWAWLLAGILLTRPTIHHFFAVMAAYVVQTLIVQSVQSAGTLSADPVTALIFGMTFIAVFMGVNMSRAKTNQHHFS